MSENPVRLFKLVQGGAADPFTSDQPLLKSGGGGGTSGGMEQKVAVLESDVKEIKVDLKTLIKDVAELKGRVSQLPTTIQMLGFVVAIVVAAGLVKHFFP